MRDPDRTGVTLTCPRCEAALSARDRELRCDTCGESVPVVDGIPHFPVAAGSTVPSAFDALSSIYETRFWFPVVYRLIGGLRAPADDRSLLADALDGAGAEVLDVACGTGRFTRYIATDAAFVWGIDVSTGMVRRAQRYAARDGLDAIAFARMDAENLRFKEATFDGVSCCWALHLFGEIPTAVAEMYRVLTPDGRLVGTTLSRDWLLALPGARSVLRRTIGVRVFDREGLRDLLFDAGFTTVQFERYGAALFFSAEK